MSVLAISTGDVKSQIAKAAIATKASQKRSGAHLSMVIGLLLTELNASASNSSFVIRGFQSKTIIMFVSQ